MADNIEYDHGSGDLHSGSIPLPLNALKAMKDHGKTTVPGGVQVLKKKLHKKQDDDVNDDHTRGSVTTDAAGGVESGEYEVQGDVCTHNGGLLSHVSSGLVLDSGSARGQQTRRIALVGSPFSRGVLMCKLPQ
jgi:hypothetical protein